MLKRLNFYNIHILKIDLFLGKKTILNRPIYTII